MTQPDEHEIELHGGHELETGLLERLREWTDLFPWWRLIRILRIAASPTMLVMTAGTMFVWIFGLRLVTNLADGGLERLPALFYRETSALGLAWTILIWAPPVIVLTRQGGLLAAGRTMSSFRSAVTLGMRRSWRGWLAGAIPPLAAFLLALLVLPIGWLARIAPGQTFVEVSAGLISALVAIPAGVIAFGGLVAIPLSWAALGNEQDSDPLNALSRGYEALFRRPLHLAFYLFIGALIGWVIRWIALGIAIAATFISDTYLGWSGCSPAVFAVTASALAAIPVVVLTTLGWGLAGGIYLLLRYDTGGQEVEDIWEQETASAPPLPQLPAT